MDDLLSMVLTALVHEWLWVAATHDFLFAVRSQNCFRSEPTVGDFFLLDDKISCPEDLLLGGSQVFLESRFRDRRSRSLVPVDIGTLRVPAVLPSRR